MRPSVRALRGLVLAAAVVAAAAAPVAANGRAPESVKIRFRPGTTSDLLLGVTFGLMVSHDDTATWRWICESAVGFQGTYDPDYEYTASGAIFATTFDGLRYTRDGCTWSGVGAPLGTWLVTAVAVGPDDAIYAGAADPVLGSGIFKSTDDGATFQPTGDLGQVFDWFDSIEVAAGPGGAQWVYVTGYRLQAGQPREKLLFRSLDGGATWETLPTTAFVGTDLSDITISAITPGNPDVVYARLTFISKGLEEAIYRTDSWSRPRAMGGPQWTRVAAINGNITAVVARQNGEVWATTRQSGTYRSPDGVMAFAQVPGLDYEGYCLAERPSDQSLWLCSNHLPPSLMALGRSLTGEAGTWMVKLDYAAMLGPVRCAPGNDQHDDCEVNLWCGLREQFGVTSTEIDCAVDAGVDGPGPKPDPKPCCSSGGAPGLEGGVVAIALLWRRRRRQKPRPA